MYLVVGDVKGFAARIRLGQQRPSLQIWSQIWTSQEIDRLTKQAQGDTDFS